MIQVGRNGVKVLKGSRGGSPQPSPPKKPKKRVYSMEELAAAMEKTKPAAAATTTEVMKSSVDTNPQRVVESEKEADTPTLEEERFFKPTIQKKCSVCPNTCAFYYASTACTRSCYEKMKGA